MHEGEQSKQHSASISLPDSMDTRVFTRSGALAGNIEALHIDLDSGIVRFTDVCANNGTALRVPWAALLRNKSGGYTLTHLGESLFCESGAMSSRH